MSLLFCTYCNFQFRSIDLSSKIIAVIIATKLIMIMSFREQTNKKIIHGFFTEYVNCVRRPLYNVNNAHVLFTCLTPFVN